MKRPKLLKALFVTGVGILGASIILTVVASWQNPQPEVDSFGPGGLAAYSELLRRSGIETGVERAGVPRFDRKEVPVIIGDATRLGRLQQTAAGEEFKMHISEGGSAMVIVYSQLPPLEEAVRKKPSQAITSSIVPLRGKITGSTDFLKLGIGAKRADLLESQFEAVDARVVLARFDDERTYLDTALIEVWSVGEGRLVLVYNWLPFQNEFIAELNNAEFVLLATQAARKDSSEKVVFVESAFATGAASVIEIMGPWLGVLMWQLLAIFVMLVWFWNVRLGFSQVEPRRGTIGSRGTLEALAVTALRSRLGGFAIEQIKAQEWKKVARHLRFANSESLESQQQFLPDAVYQAFKAACSPALNSRNLGEVRGVMAMLVTTVDAHFGHVGRLGRPRRRR